ncbi:MAG: metallophosphoesterase family protein [Candidatus Omnitrophota bacterium]|jgi:diadenosine tetraphosphatase ApaH/serine/threonine PP2A family protein phosphatase
MRYAFLSDIHGNIEALEAVVDEFSKHEIDECLCLGDIVGYGADPKECIRTVQFLKPRVCVAGNHEWGVTGQLGLNYFNENARMALEWTLKALDGSEIEYLKSFPLVYNNDEFTVVHGSLERPEEFSYVMDKEDATPTLKLMKTEICFLGHSHVAGIYYSDAGNIARFKGTKLRLKRGRRYVINVGSIGQPRDFDPRASFAIYDTDKNIAEIIRVDYNIKAAQGKILSAGLPARLASRLSDGT